jgi:sulfatase maturation enzyme AslB (radical SAM superfamily)
MNSYFDYPFRIISAIPFPVFCQNRPEISLFYAPGYLAVTAPQQADEMVRQIGAILPSSPEARLLQEHARQAARQWENHCGVKAFKPLCLTLYTSQLCNLKCSYCFSQDDLHPEPDLDLAFIRQAAKKVAANCKEEQVPFTLVIHGGGEPTLDARLPEILAAVDETAAYYGIGAFKYLATNGVMPEETALWAVQAFDQIGLSCDGPPDIQAANRPLQNGRGSVEQIERTAGVIHRSGKPLHIRATITCQTIERMPEIAAYLCGVLQASVVRVEPVFQGGRTHLENAISPNQADCFCSAFLEARRVAARYGSRWSSTGSRPGEIHGRFCQVFREVLQLVPGNGVSACFKIGGRRQAQDRGMDIRDHTADGFGIDMSRVPALQSILAKEDPACDTCFNRYHCDRGCPDHCPANPDPKVHPTGGELRCRVNRMLTSALLQKQAEHLKPLLRDHPAAGCVIQGEL